MRFYNKLIRNKVRSIVTGPTRPSSLKAGSYTLGTRLSWKLRLGLGVWVHWVRLTMQPIPNAMKIANDIYRMLETWQWTVVKQLTRCVILALRSRGVISTFSWGGGKKFFYFLMPPDYWKIGKKQHFICSNLTSFIVPFFLFLSFFSFFLFSSLFSFFFSFFLFPCGGVVVRLYIDWLGRLGAV